MLAIKASLEAVMNKLATVFLAATVALALTVIYLAYQLGMARDAGAQAQVPAGQPVQPTPSPARTLGGMTLRASDCVASGASAADSESVAVGGEEPGIELASPAAQRVMRAVRLAQLKRDFADFVELHELDREDAGKLYEILLEESAEHARLGSQEPTVNQAQSRALETRYQERMANLLGEYGASQFRAYRQTVMARFMVEQLAGQLDALDMPLSSDQKHKLIRAVVEDRRQFPVTDTSSNHEELRREQQERLSAIARSVLFGGQLRYLEDTETLGQELDSAGS
jgi:hypothetical protein